MDPKISLSRLRFKAFRVVLTLSLVAVLGGLVLIPLVFTESKQVFRLKAFHGLDDLDNTLRNATYHGRTQKDAPFRISADLATNTTPTHADLVGLKARLMDNAWGGISAAASQGSYDKNTNILNLNGHVVLTTDSGYALRTPSAQIDVSDEVVQGSRVEGEGPLGTVSAEGFNVHGDEMCLKGPSRLVIECK